MRRILLGAAAVSAVAWLWSRRRRSLRGHVAVIASGSRGLGLELARELGERGCKLVVCGQDRSALRGAHRKLEARGFAVVAMRSDVRDEGELDAVLAAARSTFGRVDLLVNDEVEAGPLERSHRSERLDAMLEGLSARDVAVTTVYREAIRTGPMSAERVARSIVRAIERGERFVFLGSNTHAANGRAPAPSGIRSEKARGYESGATPISSEVRSS